MPVAVPIDPMKMIEVARESLASASAGPGRPRSVLLRRSVSSAYYALFHCLTRETAGKLLPLAGDVERLRLARTLGHADMKKACSWVAGRQGGVHQHAQPIVASLRTTAIADVATSFCDLQEARHRADYDHLAVLSKATAIAHVNDAEKAITTLPTCDAADRDAFFSLLILCARV